MKNNKAQKIPIIDVKKYGGKQVAILEGKIITSGKTLDEVVKRIKRSLLSRPMNEIQIFSVPKTLLTIYYVS